jgi:hypothetical protein
LTITTKDKNSTALVDHDEALDIESQPDDDPDSGHSSDLPHSRSTGKKTPTSISVLQTDNTTLTDDVNGGRWWTKWPFVVGAAVLLTVVIVVLVVTLALVSTVTVKNNNNGASPIRVPTSPPTSVATNHSQVDLNYTTTVGPTQSPRVNNNGNHRSAREPF